MPCFVKPLTRRALRRANWPLGLNRLISAVTLPFVKIVARSRPLRAEVRLLQRFDDSFTELWESVAAQIRPGGAPRRVVSELEVRHRAARPLLDRRACGATTRTSATRSTGTWSNRAAG